MASSRLGPALGSCGTACRIAIAFVEGPALIAAAEVPKSFRQRAYKLFEGDRKREARNRDQRLLRLLRGTDEHLPALGIPLSHQHEMVPKSATTQSAAPAD